MVFVAGIVFIIVFALVLGIGFCAGYRPDVTNRIDSAIAVRPSGLEEVVTLKRAGGKLGSLVTSFERFLPKSQSEASIIKKRLVRAGYRDESIISIFYGAKVLVPISLCGFVVLAGQTSFMLYVSALGVGFLAPDFWLGRMIKNRQKRIRLGLPDVLDLIVICVEAGLGLDQAVNRTVSELHHAQPDICEELGVVVLELRAGKSRVDAWKSMADRTDVDSVRNFVSMLIQSEQFGTGIAKTLRIHAETLRTERVQLIEEMAAKTTVKLIFPLALFIFPSLFIVTLGPAAILMADSFGKYLSH